MPPLRETELKYILLPPSSDVQVVCPRNKKSELIGSILMDDMKKKEGGRGTAMVGEGKERVYRGG